MSEQHSVCNGHSSGMLCIVIQLPARRELFRYLRDYIIQGMLTVMKMKNKNMFFCSSTSATETTANIHTLYLFAIL